MKTILLIVGIFLNISIGYSQKKPDRVSLSSEFKNVVLRTKPVDTDSQNAPVLHLLSPNLKKNGTHHVNSDIKIFTISGLAYAKGNDTISSLRINNDEVKLGKDDFFNKVVILSPGKNRFIVKATTINNFAASDTVIISYQNHDSKQYLFHIAIDEYKHWPDLSNPVKNATDFNVVLNKRYGFKAENIIRLYNDSATTENIYEKFSFLINTVTNNDKLIIFFSGHGHFDEKIEEGYWIPHDAREDKLSDYITNSEVSKFINAIDSKHTLLLADACFAGTLLETTMRGEEHINYNNFDKRKSRWAFTSGSIEKVEDKSLFTENLVKFFSDNVKSRVLFTDLSKHIIETVSINSDQMPVVGPLKYVDHEGGQFVFTLEE